jgi:cytochrome P450
MLDTFSADIRHSATSTLASLLAVFTLTVIFLYYVHDLWAKAAIHAKERRHNCQKPSRYPHRGWLGLDLMRERQIASDEGRSRACMDYWFEKLGQTWEENIGGQRLINTIDIDNVRATFNADMETLGRAGAFHKNDFLGPGIFSSDGPRWKWARSVVTPLFKKTEVRSMVMFKHHVDLFISLIPRDGSTIDVQPLLKKMNFDSQAESIFGRSTDSLLPGSQYSDGEFIEAFNYANSGSLKRRKAGRLAFRYSLDREYTRTVAEVHSFVDQQVRLELEPQTTDAEPKDDGRYVLLRELAKQTRDPLTLRYECLNLFAGARDGVAVVAANALFCLARNPELWSELRRCALAMGQTLDFSFEAESLKPFRKIIYETIRSTGPSAIINRTAFKDAILPRGGGPTGESPILVKKGDQIRVFGWGCNHIKTVWGEDAYKFRPDRWEDFKTPPEFVPFGGGRRICPAYQQVYVQSAYVLIRLAQEFESIDNRDPVVEYLELDRNLTESRNGVQIGLTAARAREMHMR